MTDFREMIRRDAGGAAANEAPESPFRAMIRRDREASAQAAAASARLAPLDPESYGKAVSDSREIGLPADVIARNPEQARALTISKRMSAVTKAHPKLGTWFSRDDNAAIASDDTEGLGNVAGAMPRRATVSETVNKSLAAGTLSPTGGTLTALGETFNPFRQLKQIGSPALQQVLSAIFPTPVQDVAVQTGGKLTEAGRVIGAESVQGLKRPGSVSEALADPGNALQYYGGLTGQSLPAMAVAAGTRNPAVASEVVGLLTGAQAYGQGRAEGQGAFEAGQSAVAQAVIEKALGGETFEAALKPGGMLAGYLKTAGTEAVTEGVTGGGQYIAGQLVAGKEIDAGELSAQAIDSAIMGGGLGAATQTITDLPKIKDQVTGAVRTLHKASERFRSASVAETDATALDSLVKTVGDSKLAVRSPERLQALIGELAEPGMDTVYLPAEKLETYFQSQGLDPAAMVEAATGDPDAFQVAKIANGDIAVPLAAYVTQWGKDHHAALSSSARLAPDGIPASEADAARKEAQDAIDEMLAAEPEAAGGVDAVAAELTNMLVSTGRYGPDEARAAAVIPARTIAGIAKLQGLDPMALLQSQGLSITAGETGERKGRTAPTPEVTDEEVRQFAEETFEQGPKSLSDFERERGIDSADAKRDLEDWEKSRSDARAKIASMPTVREYVEWQGRNAAGKDPERDTAMLANLKAGGDRAKYPYYYVMKDRLAQAKAERDTLTALAKTDAPTITEEKAEEPSFWRRFFQPAYHGTPHDVDRFSLQKIGTGEGAQAFGWGLYFAGQKDIAKQYQKTLANRGSIDRAERIARETFPGGDRGNIGGLIAQAALLNISAKKQQYRNESIRALDTEKLQGAIDQFKKEASGKLYEVEVPDDGDLLDYDLPMSKQPHAVRDKLRPLLDEFRGGLVEENFIFRKDYETGAWMAQAQGSGPNGRMGRGDTKESAMADFADTLTGADLYRHLEENAAERLDAEGVDASEMSAAKAASHALFEAGIPGLRFLDGTSRKNGKGSHNYVIWDEAAISEPTRLEQSTGKPRGAITFGDGKATIQLFEGMDLSTFQHEMAHFNLELFKSLAESKDATDQIKAEYAKIETYLGAKAGEKLTADQHETFARSFEAYLYEGIAPTESLRGAFARVAAWMRAVYSSLKSLNVNLTPEVREVFDRLLAADEEVIAAEQRQDYAPLFKDATSMGVSESRFNAYLDAIQNAHDRAVQRATKAVLSPVRQRLTKEYRLLRESIKEQVSAEVQADPLQQAIANLQRGTLPDGKPLPEGVPALKLNRAAVTDQMGTAFAKSLPRGVLSDDGAPADMVAAAYGFPSSEAFLLAMSRAPNRKAYIAAESDARARATLADPLVNGTMAEVAMAAAHNTMREAATTAELDRLADLAGVPRADARALNLAAETRVAGMKSRDLRPSQYLRAERTAANEAQKAAGKQKWAEAFKAKREQAINAALYRAALAQVAKTDSNLRFLRKQAEPRTMERLGKAGPEYLDAMELLLEAYELKAVTYARQRSRESLRGWYDRMIAAGETPLIGDEVMEQVEAARKTNFSQLTGRQVQAIKDAAANVSALARGNLEAIVHGEKVALLTIDQGLAASVRAANFSGRPKPVDPAAEGWFQKQRRSFSSLAAVLFRPEAIVNWIDGESNVKGWAHQTFMRPLNDAQAAERDLTKSYTERVFKAIQANVKVSGHLSDIVATATLGGEFTRGGLIAAALNMGNAGNLQRMRDGNGWGPVQQAEVLSKLTKADADFVQSLWDIIDSLWPQIAALEQRVTGVKPPKTEAVPLTFTTSDGHTITLAGGYFPIMYDKDSPQFQRLNKSTDASPFEGGYVSAFTSHGFTKTREREVKIPLLFDLNAVPRHLTDVIHDLTHREALLTAWKVLNGSEVTAAFNETGSGVLRDMLKFKLKQVANGAVLMGGGPLSAVGKFSRGVRRRISVVGLGFNVVSGLKQTLGVTSALSRLQAASDGSISGSKAFVAGFYDMFKGWGQGLEEVREQSGEMRHRMDTAASDVRQAMDRHLSGMAGGGILGTAAKAEDWMQRTAYIPIVYMQFYTVDLPTYYAGLRIAKAKGLTGADAVAFAESQVRRSQGAGGVKDEAAIENQPVAEWFLTFYSYFSTYLNEQITLGRAAKSAASNRKLVAMMPVLASRAALLMVIPPILEDLVNQALGRSEGPPDEEDEESRVAYYLKLILPYWFAGIPIVRDIAKGAASPFGYSATPVGQVFESFLTVGKDIAKAADPDEEVETRRVVMDSLKAASYALGLPLVAPGRQVDYLVRVMNGDEEPDSNSEFWLALLGGKKETKK